MKNSKLFWPIFLVVSLAVSLTACGGGGGGGGGSSSGTTGATLEINGPASNPPAVLAGEQTIVKISAYVSGSHVELQKFDGANYITVGEMKDDGQNGDQTAGDKVYTIQIPAKESVGANITYRIRATSNGQEQTRVISIPVVHIPALATNIELNQTTKDLFLKSLETQALITSLNTNIANTPSGTIDQVGNNLLSMFSNFEAVTNQLFGFKLFGLAKEAKSVTQLMDIFSDNPFDPRVSSIKKGVIDSGCLGELDLSTVSDLERRLCARYYLFNRTINPDGEGVQFLKNSQKVIIKEIISEPTSLAGDGLSGLFGWGALGKFAVKEILGQGVGIIVDWFLDNNAEQNILIGQVQDAEEFSMPSGTHNVLYSFGGDKSKAVVKNINVPSQKTTTIEFSPGTITEQDISPPSAPTGLTATAVSSLQIDLAWTASTDNIAVAGYNIYRGGSFLKAVTTISTRDTGLSPSAQYCYSVSAYDAAGNESGQSSQACAMTQAPPLSPPSTPAGLAATAVSSSQINLSWTASTGTVTGYRVYRNGSKIQDNISTTSTSDTGLSPSTNYCYYVIAYNSAGESAQTSQICATTQVPPLSPPTTPTGFAVTAASSSQIDLAWTASTGSVSGYKVYKNGAYLKSIATNSTSDTGLSPFTNYCYSVTAYNSAGESAQTSQTCVTTPASSTFAGTIQLPQTGQTTCYDASNNVISCAGTGQDGDTRTGVAWPNPRFTDNGDGTVTDNLTGLIWTKDANVMKTRDPGFDTDGTAGDGAVTWQRALDYIKKLNQENYLGHNDWRLPNVNELASLWNYGQADDLLWLNSQGFANLPVNFRFYWSSSTFVPYSTSFAWTTKDMWFGTGYMDYFSKSSNLYFIVWPVRTGQSGSFANLGVSLPATGQNTCYNALGSEITCAGTGQDGDTRTGVAWPNPRFTDNGDGTVTDNLTGLIWTKDANIMKTRDPSFDADGDVGDGAVTWQRALDYIKKLNQESYLGHNDWRLPNIKELLSLVNYGQSNGLTWLNSQGFINVQMFLYWSSSSRWSYPTRSAWVVYMFMGSPSLDIELGPRYDCVWPVRAR